MTFNRNMDFSETKKGDKVAVYTARGKRMVPSTVVRVSLKRIYIKSRYCMTRTYTRDGFAVITHQRKSWFNPDQWIEPWNGEDHENEQRIELARQELRRLQNKLYHFNWSSLTLNQTNNVLMMLTIRDITNGRP